eukprot:scaffold31313_cov57-Phaeocystis_antarctica.AAC.1
MTVSRRRAAARRTAYSRASPGLAKRVLTANWAGMSAIGTTLLPRAAVVVVLVVVAAGWAETSRAPPSAWARCASGAPAARRLRGPKRGTNCAPLRRGGPGGAAACGWLRIRRSSAPICSPSSGVGSRRSASWGVPCTGCGVACLVTASCPAVRRAPASRSRALRLSVSPGGSGCSSASAPGRNRALNASWRLGVPPRGQASGGPRAACAAAVPSGSPAVSGARLPTSSIARRIAMSECYYVR